MIFLCGLFFLYIYSAGLKAEMFFSPLFQKPLDDVFMHNSVVT